MSTAVNCESSSKCGKGSPTNIGTAAYQDKIASFWRNPTAFVQNNIQENSSRVFLCRFALRPCFIISSNKLVREFLNEKSDQSYNGLRDFVYSLFGQNILFSDPEEAKVYREIILRLMKPMQCSPGSSFQDSINVLTNRWMLNELTTQDPIVLYKAFKRFSTNLVLQTFLGVDESSAPDLSDRISKLSTTHWHGIISVSMNVKLFSFMSNSYRKSMEAKDELLSIIEQRLTEESSDFLTNFLKETSEDGMDIQTMKNHVLVFICALIPKALASLLTSFVDSSVLWHKKYVSEDGEIKEEDVENILLEILRLFPPFFGCFRVATSDFDLGEFHVPKGHGLFCVNFAAQRDPEVFPQPDEFLPERWTSYNKNDRDKVFTFGSGPTSCVGERMMWSVLKLVAPLFVKTFVWDPKTYFPPEIKYLPVARPKHLEPVILRKRV